MLIELAAVDARAHRQRFQLQFVPPHCIVPFVLRAAFAAAEKKKTRLSSR
jgi:hypothetical protein